MKRLVPFLAILSVILFAGCEDMHNKHKAAAQQRWSEARTKIAYKLAQEQLQNGDLQKAETTAQNLLEMDSKCLPGYILSARIYMEQNSVIKARDTLLQCLEIEPAYPAAHYYLGIIQERVKELPEALEHYRAAWEGEPKNSGYFLALIETLVAMDRSTEALQAITENLNLVEQDAATYVIAGNIYAKRGEDLEALEMYRKARHVDPMSVPVRETLAFAYHRAGMAEQALLLFEQLQAEYVRKNNAENNAYLLAMGDCYMDLGQAHQAKRAYEKVGQEQPLNPIIWTRLAQAALARNRFEEADQYAQRALTLNPDLVEALMVKGYIALHQEDAQQAVTYFGQCVRLESGDAVAHCLLGQAQEKAGNPAEAAASYQRALKIRPGDKMPQAMLSRLQKTSMDQAASTQAQ